MDKVLNSTYLRGILSAGKKQTSATEAASGTQQTFLGGEPQTILCKWWSSGWMLLPICFDRDICMDKGKEPPSVCEFIDVQETFCGRMKVDVTIQQMSEKTKRQSACPSPPSWFQLLMNRCWTQLNFPDNHFQILWLENLTGMFAGCLGGPLSSVQHKTATRKT